MNLTAIMNICRKKRIFRAAAMVPNSKGEFWALVGADTSPASPYAQSRAEFELKLAAAGMEMTGREISPADAGLSTVFCVDHNVKTFEVRHIGS